MCMLTHIISRGGEGEKRRRGEGEKRRRGEGEKGRRGEGEKRRKGEGAALVNRVKGSEQKCFKYLTIKNLPITDYRLLITDYN
jgi:hypothetical protein